MSWYSVHLSTDQISADAIHIVEQTFINAWCAGGKLPHIQLHGIQTFEPKTITYYLYPLKYDFANLKHIGIVPKVLDAPPKPFSS